MNRKAYLVFASIIFIILLTGCKSENEDNVVIQDCTDSLKEEQVENVLSRVLVPLQVDKASGSWEMWKYKADAVKVTKSDCEMPDCLLLDETCTIEADLTNFETLKFEKTDTTAIYNPDKPDELDDETKQLLIPSTEIDGNIVHITKKFINNSTCVDYEGPSVDGELKKCEIWETEVKFEYAEKQYATCSALTKGEDFGAGENKEITSPTDTEAESLEELMKECEKSDAPEGKENRCGFYGKVDFTIGSLEPVTKETYDLEEYLNWLDNYSDYTIYLDIHGDPQNIEIE